MHRLSLLRRLFCWLGLLVILSSVALQSAAAQTIPVGPETPQDTFTNYLPMLRFNDQPVTPPDALPGVRRVNIPYFNGTISKPQTAIFWLGRITPYENYADVRIGYNASELFVRIQIFDRLLWYDATPFDSQLNEYDSTSLYLQIDGGTPGAPTTQSYRFDTGISDWQTDRSPWMKVYRGNGSNWGLTSTAFTTVTGIRWQDTNTGGINNNQNNRGWYVEYRIPFTSLGLSGAPAAGTLWGLGVAVHDRDDSGGALRDRNAWPEANTDSLPITWGQAHFGLPGYTAPNLQIAGTSTIRHGVGGANVPDAHAGGHSMCGEGMDFFTEWPNRVYHPNYAQVVVQSQGDVADWPCYSKYYITFPLSSIPAGKTIISASLRVHQFGGSDPSRAESSLIQVSVVNDAWTDSTLNWNNAPLALENVSQAWVDVLPVFPGWPGVARTWDVSRAVAMSYQSGQPLRLVLYMADMAYHSGKYFYGSEAEEAGRPQLIVNWGNP